MSAFDVDTYPLETATQFAPRLGTVLDEMSDGSLRLRVVSTNKPIAITCVFCPMTASQSQAFESYLYDNAATSFEITHNSKTYSGYIDGDSLQKDVSGGALHLWTFVLKGVLV